VGDFDTIDDAMEKIDGDWAEILDLQERKWIWVKPINEIKVA
jgi:hypothetical protein